MQDFTKLRVWERSHELALKVYGNTRSFPKAEQYGIISQMRRASVSIPANIAEGCGRAGTAEFSRFLQIAIGSASELEYFLILARDLEYIDQSTFQDLESRIVEIKQMLTALIKRVKAPEAKNRQQIPVCGEE